MPPKRPLFRTTPRRGRKRLWLVLLALPLAALATVIAPLAGDREPPPLMAGVGVPLDLAPVTQLPSWALDAVHDLKLGADYQFVAIVIDLNRDEQPEILLAPAPPRQDLFIADSPLRVLVHVDGAWQVDDTRLSCRPNAIGGFVTNDWWDLRCRSPRGAHVLRYNGLGYRVAGR